MIIVEWKQVGEVYCSRACNGGMFCIEPLFPGQFRCLKLVGLSFCRVTVLDFLSRPIPVFFCPTNHAF